MWLNYYLVLKPWNMEVIYKYGHQPLCRWCTNFDPSGWFRARRLKILTSGLLKSSWRLFTSVKCTIIGGKRVLWNHPSDFLVRDQLSFNICFALLAFLLSLFQFSSYVCPCIARRVFGKAPLLEFPDILRLPIKGLILSRGCSEYGRQTMQRNCDLAPSTPWVRAGSPSCKAPQEHFCAPPTQHLQ